MKESTKNRLKKVGKVSLYCLGLGFALLSGLVVGKCSADNANRSSSGESSLESPTHHVLRHEGESLARSDSPSLPVRRALDPLEYPTLGEESNNLLKDAEGGHYYLSYDSGQAGYSFSLSSNTDTFLLQLAPGAYLLDYLAETTSWRGQFFSINDTGATQVRKAFNGEPLQRVFLENASIGWASSFNTGSKHFIVNISADFPYFLSYLVTGSVISLTLYDPLFAPSVASIDMGEYYNPLPMIGQTINDSSIIVYPSAGSSVNVAPVDFVTSSANPFLFVSSGKVFDGFRIELSRVMNVEGSQIERYANKSGETVIAPNMSLNYVTANAFYYRLAGSSQWVKVWELPYNGTDKGYNYWSYNGRWLSSSFRYVEVKLDGGSTGLSTWLPTFTLSDLLSLNVWTAGALVLGDSYNNVFTMLGKGFESVGGILTIQILPYLSLGTLIFVPLIVLIIFAILRILNK